MKDALLNGVVFATLIGLFLFAANDWQLPGREPPVREVPWCEAHDVALDLCEICNPALARGGTQVLTVGEPAPDECPNTYRRIHLGEGVAEGIGLELAVLDLQDVDERLRVNAQALYPPDGFARVAPRLSGVILEVRAKVGDEVDEETVLAVLDCPELGQAQSDHRVALVERAYWEEVHQRRQASHPKVTTLQELTEAEAELARASLEVQRTGLRLRDLGMGEAALQALDEGGAASSRWELRPPFAGVVVGQDAVVGETATTDGPLFDVADRSRMWLALDLQEEDLTRVEPGQRVTFTVDGLTGRRFPGAVVALGGAVDPQSRTVTAFAEVKNVQGLLRASMYGEAEVRIRPPEQKLLVPRTAVQNDGDCLLAFVSSSQDVFLPRKVEVGAAFAGGFEVLGGLAPGDRVATTGSFLLKTELLRGQIGAG